MIDVIEYLNEADQSPFGEWLSVLHDTQAVARIDARIERLAQGLFGDCKPLDAGVWELRIDYGPGYRVYYAQAGRRIVLLLAGGDKRSQRADIKRALGYWQNWQKRSGR